MRPPSILVCFAPLALASLVGCKIDNRVLMAPGPGSADAGLGGIPFTPGVESNGDAGIVTTLFSAGDYYDSEGDPGLGTCPRAGFPEKECSVITSPTPGAPYLSGLPGVCTSGVAAVPPHRDDGSPDTSDVWGNMIGFDLNYKPGDAATDWITGANVYDVTEHGIVGFAFDLDAVISGSDSAISIPPIRVEFPTEGTEANPAYWGGATMDVSPVPPMTYSGSYQIRWADVGGPPNLQGAPPFDPSKLKSIQFHIPSSSGPYPTSYNFCILNTVMLTGP